MIDQYFGIKELYEVVLRAKVPMQFGSRFLEADEPVLYFENVSMSLLSEQSAPIMARGGWANLPRVIWEDRSEVKFTLSEGVLSSISLGVLLNAAVRTPSAESPLLVSKREGPYKSNPGLFTAEEKENQNDEDPIPCRIALEHWPVDAKRKKTFIFEYDRDVAQKKIYGKRIHNIPDPFDNNIEVPCIELYEDKELTQYADVDKKYIVDYYYEYGDEALIYSISKERFNGLFTLEGKFYSKDENEGLDYTNLIYMPKVRVVSDINLRLGERADPTTSVFNIIGMPENIGNKKSLILEITRLNSDIDGVI